MGGKQGGLIGRQRGAYGFDLANDPIPILQEYLVDASFEMISPAPVSPLHLHRYFKAGFRMDRLCLRLRLFMPALAECGTPLGRLAGQLLRNTDGKRRVLLR